MLWLTLYIRDYNPIDFKLYNLSLMKNPPKKSIQIDVDISSQHKVEPIHAMIWSFWRSYHICISRMIKLFNTYEIFFGSFFISISKNEIESLNWRFWGLPNTHIFPRKSVGFWVDDYVSSRFQIISRPEQRFSDSL